MWDELGGAMWANIWAGCGGEVSPNRNEDATDVDYEKVASPWPRELVQLRKLMTRVDQHTNKRIFRKGHEWRDPVPDNARVLLERFQYPYAAIVVEKTIAALKTFPSTNAEEEQRRTELLILLSHCLMFCFNRLGRPKCACALMEEVRLISGRLLQWRTLCEEGHALEDLGEYELARSAFLEAQQKQPDNKSIEACITNLDSRLSNIQKGSNRNVTSANLKMD
ncbi:hypothetical protein M5D96_011297 [Drosophila gunungcola]|uniref:Uncharacterized protein n=1 Tax=Drosophila gunungcola TaxID=103775 RepID=A0A9P9YFG9_9MUSC|nr:hypothetical protein M5D96_011297 [Drosophila gunungcola]